MSRSLKISELERIAERVLKIAKATGMDGAEVDAGANVDALTRFANNTIHQNVAEETLAISFRAIVDGRTARATTNKTDDESLQRLVASAASLAKNQPKNPDLLPLLGKQKYQKVSRFFSSTAETTPQDRAKAVAKVCKMAARRKQTSAGIYVSGSSQSILANSKGLFARYEQTRAEFSVTILESDSSGWAKANAPDIRKIDPLALAESASEKSAKSRKPRELPPGHYVAILEPAAVLDLMGFLFFDFGGTAVLDERSCLTGRMGKKLFGDNITVWDDAYHPLQTGQQFDGEGEPRQKVLLVDRGVPKNLVYARSPAKKMKAKPTGHGFPLPNDFGEAPMNIVFAGGDKSIDEMILSTARGVLVTRLWYIREVDPYAKILTGMTRDGTFLVENGEIAGGVRNFRFNQSVIEMLANVEMLGPAVRSAGEEAFEMVVPAMKVRDFHFSEVTKF
ncbi:MAG TPA: TldD/PmbA family protein [Candidatus Acidoferrales bacterium]|nr:TldD/PmbA family protein [Candidatus Acidoferrales bacterium]